MLKGRLPINGNRPFCFLITFWPTEMWILPMPNFFSTILVNIIGSGSVF